MIFPDIEAYRASGFVPEVCVIGSGPAGMSITLQLAKAGIPVVMLEAGSEDVTEESQDFYRGTVDGDPYFDLDVTRIRLLGGCSNHWAGWCRELDPHDFEQRDWIPNSGWPITRQDLEPFFDTARDMLDLVPFRPNVPVSDDIDWVQLIKSPAVHVGQKYRSFLTESPHVALVLETMVTDLEGDGTRVSAANLWSRGKPAGSLAVERFAVCTGGLENSRLLLWSNEKTNGAVVPQARALGRYWMEHPQFEPAVALLFDESVFEWDTSGEAFFSPSPAAMQRLGIMNFGVRLIRTPYSGVKRLVADLACYAPSMSEWVADGFGAHLRCAAQIYLGWEQSPVETNRITLDAANRDAAGVPRLVLHWKKGALERKTMADGLTLFGETLAHKNLGRLRFEDWVTRNEDYPVDQELAGHHHMGGTRMGSDPATSVVDANCKVHGMANLWVGGSSVFTTSGQCNPTTTLTTIAHRLGDHLARSIKG
ncbi:MAG: GMC family oxidoreductase [Notoacmeibacter sp.]|nr:GMC family oxidoreductase [Notoacmeibacter sp.]MCC0032213.1 GMC family oxidoreductase [Brucellaceae bacterium]